MLCVTVMLIRFICLILRTCSSVFGIIASYSDVPTFLHWVRIASWERGSFSPWGFRCKVLMKWLQRTSENSRRQALATPMYSTCYFSITVTKLEGIRNIFKREALFWICVLCFHPYSSLLAHGQLLPKTYYNSLAHVSWFSKFRWSKISQRIRYFGISNVEESKSNCQRLLSNWP